MSQTETTGKDQEQLQLPTEKEAISHGIIPPLLKEHLVISLSSSDISFSLVFGCNWTW